ncbi:MAG: hypothetical protein SGPRY_002620 [Prymnesium sp.]
MPGQALDEVAATLAAAEASVLRDEEPAPIPRRVPEVYTAAMCQPAWARGRVWDTRDPSNCVPVKPFSVDDPPIHDLNPDFFKEWGARLSWPDEDMLHRATWEGGTSHSACVRSRYSCSYASPRIAAALRRRSQIGGGGCESGVNLGRVTASALRAFSPGS